MAKKKRTPKGVALKAARASGASPRLVARRNTGAKAAATTAPGSVSVGELSVKLKHALQQAKEAIDGDSIDDTVDALSALIDAVENPTDLRANTDRPVERSC
jgi:hypothetical protein